jgi:pimeloyl-ACP methyl ester carboxylesterase
MSLAERSGWPTPVRVTLAATIAAGALVAAPGAGADIIKSEDMLRGITMTRAQCDATPQTLWVSAFGQDFCVRYYLSMAGGEGQRPVVFLNGDRFWPVNPKIWQWAPSMAKKAHDVFDETNRDADTAALMRTADAFSRMSKTTAIYLARMGVDGSSGHHIFRKTLLELHLMNAALDALKQRYGFEGFHLAGQSGGSMLVAGLAGIRRDVACAVSGSGRLAVSYSFKAKEPGRNYFEPIDYIAAMAKNPSLRFVMVADKTDEIVAVNQQSGFVAKMRRAGLHIPQFFVAATDDYHHGVVSYTELVAAGCVLGKSDTEIATAVETMDKRAIEFNELRRKETAALGKTGIASRAGGDHRLTPAAPAAASHARPPGKPI